VNSYGECGQDADFIRIYNTLCILGSVSYQG
jgi:hypothetical protein